MKFRIRLYNKNIYGYIIDSKKYDSNSSDNSGAYANGITNAYAIIDSNESVCIQYEGSNDLISINSKLILFIEHVPDNQ